MLVEIQTIVLPTDTEAPDAEARTESRPAYVNTDYVVALAPVTAVRGDKRLGEFYQVHLTYAEKGLTVLTNESGALAIINSGKLPDTFVTPSPTD